MKSIKAEFDKIQLNENQLKIVDYVKEGKNVFVDATYGSGKTTVIQKACDVLPQCHILYLTFNKQLQLDAQKRIKSKNVDIKTFHAFAFKYFPDYTQSVRLFCQNLPSKNQIKQYDAIFIDEYQDMNADMLYMTQYIVSCQDSLKSIVLVGDQNQKIYDSTYVSKEDIFSLLGREYVSVTLDTSYRLSQKLAESVGNSQNKIIRGVNDKLVYKSAAMFEAVEFLKKVDNKDIMVLGSKASLSSFLNYIQKCDSKKYNKRTVYCKIEESNNSIKDANSQFNNLYKDSMLMLTYDSCKGLERDVVVLLDYSYDYYLQRINKPNVKSNIINNLFNVARTRAKSSMLIVSKSTATVLKNSDMIKDKQCTDLAEIYYPSNLFDYASTENIEECLRFIKCEQIKPSSTIIKSDSTDCLIDLSFIHGYSISSTFFDKYNIDDFIEYYRAIYKDRKFMLDFVHVDTPIVDKLLGLAAIETGHFRYLTEVDKSKIYQKDWVESIRRRLSCYFSPQDTVEHNYFMNYEYKGRTISFDGKVDVIHEGDIYELKYCSTLKSEHKLQLSMYLAMAKRSSGYLYNVLDDSLYKVSVNDRVGFLDAVSRLILHLPPVYSDTLKQVSSNHVSKEYISSENTEKVSKNTIVENEFYALIDTETTYMNTCASIGIIIFDKNYDIKDKKYIITDASSPMVFYSQLFEKRDSSVTDEYIPYSQACDSILEFFNAYNVKKIFAYNTLFDKNVLYKISSNFDFYDIMKLTAYKKHNKFINEQCDCYATGKMKRGFGVEPMFRLVMKDNTYKETHNALNDAEDELTILRKLEKPLDYVIKNSKI